MMIEVKNIHTFYGLSHILFDISFSIEKGEIVCLLGRNGAGKTTTIRSIMGLTPPRSGIVKFKGEEITGWKPYKIARKGIGFVPEDRRIFPDLTVGENLEIAAKNSLSGEDWTVDDVYELFPALKKLHTHKGGHLSGGEQQMLAIARTLMGNPEFLLLDEPTGGLSPLVVKELQNQIQNLKDKGLTILLSEQNVRFAMKLSDRCYILDKGAICFQGTIQQLDENESIKRKYLAI